MVGAWSQETKPPDGKSWDSTQVLWDRASKAAVELERAGKEVTSDLLWKAIRKYAPDELRHEETMPALVAEALEHPAYTQLLELRKRMLVIPGLKNLGLLRDTAGQASTLAAMAALEDLILHPERVPTSEKRQLARTFMEMNLRLSGKGEEKEEGKEERSLVEIAAEEEAERSRILAKIPAELRERMEKRWDEERIRSLRTQRVAHDMSVNERKRHTSTG